MGKTRRVNVYRKKTKRLYGGNQYGPDTAILMHKLQNMQNNELKLDILKITHLPPLPDSLEKLSAPFSKLTSLPDPLPPNLKFLDVFHTKITSLPALPDTLLHLNAVNTKITSLPALPPNLKFLDVSDTKIMSLPVLPPSLELLAANNTQITSLPALPPNLVRLLVNKTPITSLPALPPKLRVLIVSDTPITSLPAFPPSLEMLDAIRCSQLTSLPDLPPNLRHLNIFYTSLPQRRFRETNAEYNARMRARNLSAAEQTILKDGSTAPPGSALQRAMDSNILKSNIVPMLTGKSGE